MNLKPEQLPAQLNSRLSPVYWVTGDETLLVEEAADLIRGKAREAGFGDRQCHFVEARFDWQSLVQSSNSLSLFAERKLIELRLRSPKLDDAGKKALAALLADPGADTMFLIISPRIEASTRKTKWFQQLEQASTLVTVWPVNADQLPRWIEQRLRGHGLTADPDALQLLSDRVEGNLLAASQEAEKLALLMLTRSDGSRHIDVRTVAASVADNARYNVFQMVDHALAGDGRKALRSLHSLKNEGAEPLALLGALSRDIRSLSRLSRSRERGENLNRSFQAERIWQNRQALFRQAMSRHDYGSSGNLLQMARQVDLSGKGMSSTPVWIVMERLITRLSGQQ